MSPKMWILAVGLLAAVSKPAGAEGLFDLGKLKAEKDAALQCELEGKWKQIHWRDTMAQALSDAAKTQKPIMVALVVGKSGEKNASQC